MAFTQARSGLIRSGAFHVGLYGREHTVTIGGTDRSTNVRPIDFSITQSLKAGHRGTFSITGITPTNLQEFILQEGNPNRYLFSGHILRLGVPLDQELLVYEVTCHDYRWLLDRFKRVTKSYNNKGINTIVADILVNFTDGGFTPGSIPSSLGNASVTFDGVLVSDALNRLAALRPGASAVTSITRVSTTATVTTVLPHGLSVGDTILIAGADQSDYNGTVTVASVSLTDRKVFTFAVSGSPTTPATGTITYAPTGEVSWRIDPFNKRVSFFDGYLDGNPVTVADGTDVMGLFCDEVSDQVRNRVIATGVGSALTAPATVGDTTIAVADTSIFDPDGGQASPEGGGELVTYTGISTGSGPGTVTGVTGLTETVPQGARLRVAAQDDDTVEQAALATTLGGGLSGVVEHQIDDSVWSASEVVRRAAAQLSAFATPGRKTSYTDIRSVLNTFLQPGKIITITITSPASVSATYRIREVAITMRGPNHTRREQQASSMPVRTVTDVVEKRKEVAV